MVNVGKLIEQVLLVRHRRKWKKKLCVLERQATFSNCLRLFVYDEDGVKCRYQDVVHAFIPFLDPNHQGTLMLVCNYKVRCMFFDKFDVLNKWIEVLHENLIYSYFHAELVVASRGSRLAKYAAHRPGYRLLTQKRSVQSNWTSNPRTRAGLSGRVCGDGYLHVTRDRICFSTGPNCSRPRLLATWNFDNDEIVQCGTARLRPHSFGPRTQTGSENPDANESDDSGPASLFFLTAFPDHPEAPGSYLFLSDRATELCEWIEQNNRSAVDQAEWRRLTSIAAVLESPDPTKLNHIDGLGSSENAAVSSLTTSTNCAMCGNRSLPEESSCQWSSPCPVLESTVASIEGKYGCTEHGLWNAISACDEVTFSKQCNVDPCFSAPSGSVTTPMENAPRIIEQQSTESTDLPFLNIPVKADNPASSTSGNQDLMTVPLSKAPLLDFHTRKSTAMYSRRRFSSHPVPATCDRCCINCTPTYLLCRSVVNSDSTGLYGSSLSRGSQLGQSEPQLVTLPPLPIPPESLRDYLEHRSKFHAAGNSLCMTEPHSAPLCSSIKASCTVWNSCSHTSSHKEFHAESTVSSIRKHTNLSECSANSTSDSVTSQPKCCSPLAQPCSTQTTLCTDVDHISQPPFMTATGSCASTAPVLSTASSAVSGHPHLLNRSLSSGNSPQFHYTPLHPTCTVIPGSQYFARHRRHTASASEALSFDSGCSSGDAGTNPAGSVLMAPMHITKTSFVSLAASAIPLWAEAPSKAKPRTGGNYVSREMIASLYSQRKQKHEQQQQNQQPPPPPPQRSLASSGIGTSSLATNSTSLVHPHPCTPVPEVPKESGTFDDNCLNSTENCDRGCKSRVPPDKLFPTIGALETRELSPVTEPLALQFPSVTSDSARCPTTTTRLVQSDAIFPPSQVVGRSYINMVPPSHRGELKPIEESRQSNNDSVSSVTQPIVHRSLIELEHAPVSSSSSTTGLLDSINRKNSTASISALGNASTTSSASSAQSSYVNFTTCAPSTNPTETTVSNSLSGHYINLASPTLPSFCDGSGTIHCDSELTSATAQPSCQCNCIESITNDENDISNNHSPRKQSGRNSPGFGGPVCPAPLYVCSNHSVALVTTDASSYGNVRTTIHTHKTGFTFDNGPRLHYAHLTLSNTPTCRAVRPPQSTVLDQLGTPAPSYGSVSSSNVPRPRLHAVQSLPCSFGNSSAAATSVAGATPTPDESNILSASSTPSSGLNYVTIDFVQTKALSELERELRGAAESDNGTHPIFNPNARRAVTGRSLTSSATLPGSSTNTDPLNRHRVLERAFSHSGGTNGKFDGPSVSFPIRVLSRWAHSLNFHHHAQANGQGRNEKQGTRRRFGRAVGLCKAPGSVTTSASPKN